MTIQIVGLMNQTPTKKDEIITVPSVVNNDK